MARSFLRILSFLTVNLLVTRVSAAYAYRYATSDCSGDPVGGTYAETGSCLAIANFKLTCNATHLIQQDCYDSDNTDVKALNNCSQYQQFFCSGDITNPPEGTAYWSHFYLNDQCGGGSNFYQWVLFDKCKASDGEGSSKISKNTTTGKIDTWGYSSDDCSGTGVLVTSDDSEKSITVNYIDSAKSFTGKINNYFYLSDDCSGSAFEGVTFANDGCESPHTGYECDNSKVVIYSYGNGDCPKGVKQQVSNLTTDCNPTGGGGSSKFTCSTSFNVPAQSYFSGQYSKADCSSMTMGSFSALGVCIEGDKWSYDSSQKLFTRTTYDNTNCTGATQTVTQSPLSYSVSLSSTTSSSSFLTPSSFFLFAPLFFMVRAIFTSVVN